MTNKIKGLFSQLTKNKKKKPTLEGLHPSSARVDEYHPLQVGLDFEHFAPGLTLRCLKLCFQQKDP